MSPNVLLIILDSVRARNTSLHDHLNETTPFLERLGRRATVYDQARAPGTWSLPSHTSIFTGLHVEEHRVTDFEQDRLRAGHTIWERLRDEYGYATGVFSSNPFITNLPVGLAQGFETVKGRQFMFPFPSASYPGRTARMLGGDDGLVDRLGTMVRGNHPLQSMANGLSARLGVLPDSKLRATAGEYGDLFLAWEAARTGPWAACINFMDAHHPYEPEREHDDWGGKRLGRIQGEIDDLAWEFHGGQRPWWERKALEGLYDGGIRQIDAEIERLVTALQERNEFEDTLLVVTSDHGEGFGERNPIQPGMRISDHAGREIDEVLLHVPLLVKRPDQETSNRVEAPATLTRFPEVVRDVLNGRNGTAGFVPDGPVLASSFELNERMRRKALKYVDDVEPFMRHGRAVYTPHSEGVTKYLTSGPQSAAVVIRDAQTWYKVSTTGSDEVERAFDEVGNAGVRTNDDDDRGLDAAARQRLEELGYV